MLQIQTVEPGTLGHLKSIMLNPYLKHFTLVGGTALALQMGHRFSIDLDFFTPQQIEHDAIALELKSLGKLIETHRNRIMLQVMLDNVKIDFVHHPHPMIRPISIVENIRMATQEEIAAMKLAAITGRGVKKDFYDLYFLLKKFSLKQMIDFYIEKYTDRNYFQMTKSLSYFNDADNSDTPVLFDKKLKWEEVKKTIEEAVIKVL